MRNDLAIMVGMKNGYARPVAILLSILLGQSLCAETLHILSADSEHPRNGSFSVPAKHSTNQLTDRESVRIETSKSGNQFQASHLVLTAGSDQPQIHGSWLIGVDHSREPQSLPYRTHHGRAPPR